MSKMMAMPYETSRTSWLVTTALIEIVSNEGNVTITPGRTKAMHTMIIKDDMMLVNVRSKVRCSLS